MVLTNLGGPGDSGVATVYQLGQNLSAVVGSNYDFVGLILEVLDIASHPEFALDLEPLLLSAVLSFLVSTLMDPNYQSCFPRQPMRIQLWIESCAKWKLVASMMLVRI